jgi:hypothetical protein
MCFDWVGLGWYAVLGFHNCTAEDSNSRLVNFFDHG